MLERNYIVESEWPVLERVFGEFFFLALPSTWRSPDVDGSRWGNPS